jgi:hypothetical protein
MWWWCVVVVAVVAAAAVPPMRISWQAASSGCCLIILLVIVVVRRGTGQRVGRAPLAAGPPAGAQSPCGAGTGSPIRAASSRASSSVSVPCSEHSIVA